VGVEAGDRGAGGGRKRETRVGTEFVLDDVHTADAVTGEGAIDLGGDGAEVFADDARSVAVRFDAEDGVEFVGGIGDIGAGSGWETAWNPVESVERHDVVEAEDACELEVMAETIDEVGIAGLAKECGVQWCEAPVLPLSKDGIGRGAAGSGSSEGGLETPRVIA
jgi:hypothetical protein